MRVTVGKMKEILEDYDDDMPMTVGMNDLLEEHISINTIGHLGKGSEDVLQILVD